MFRAGQQIGIYTLINRLGRGGFGEVWLAERRAKFVTTKVAVKLPHDEQVDHDAIKQEAVLWELASGHPNVLPIIEADDYDGQVVIVSEYAPDGSLEDLLNKSGGSLPLRQAVEMTIGILSGLEFLHSRNIIHRDLKPANILLQGDTPRLADFGISRAMKTTSVSVSVAGTPIYMSPEAFDRKRNVQTDVWAVGIILFQMLAGKFPFPIGDVSEIIAAIVMREAEVLPDKFPPKLQQIVKKALAKQTVVRYQTAREMRDDLADFLISISQQSIQPTLREERLPMTRLGEGFDKTPLPKQINPTQASPTAKSFIPVPQANEQDPNQTQASPTVASNGLQLDTDKQRSPDTRVPIGFFKLPTSEITQKSSKPAYLKVTVLLSVLLIAVTTGIYLWLRNPEVSQTNPLVISAPTDSVSTENKLIPFLKGNKFGFVDVNKNLVISPVYEEASPFSNGLALVKLKGKYGYVNEKGEEVIPLKYDNAQSFSDEVAFVNVGARKNEAGFIEGGKWGAIDKTGREIIAFKYDEALPFSEKLAAVGREVGYGWKWGFIDKTGKEVIPIKYDSARTFSEGLAAINKGSSYVGKGKWGYIDKTGKEVITIKYHEAGNFSEGLAVVKAAEDSPGTLIDITGNEIFTDKAKPLVSYSEGLAMSCIDNKCGFINKTGEIVIPFKYDFSYGFMDGLAPVAFTQIINVGPADANANVPKGKDAQNMPQFQPKLGFIDRSGKEVIPFKYDDITGRSANGLIMVVADGKKFFVGKDGTEYYEP